MPWIPGTPLTSPAVRFAAIEESSNKLLAEYFGGFFSGQTLELRGTEYAFPQASIIFNQMPLPHQFEGLCIHIVNMPGRTRRCSGMDLAHNRVKWKIMAKANVRVTRPDGLNSDGLARRAGDLIYALMLSQAENGPLFDKGIHHLRPTPQTAPESVGYKCRTIMVDAMLIFTY